MTDEHRDAPTSANPQANGEGEPDGSQVIAGGEEGGLAQTSLVIHRQYIKDLSFENPNAPAVYDFFAEEGPELQINVEMSVSELGTSAHEVVVAIVATANRNDTTAFIIELHYGGVVTLSDVVTAKQAEQILLIDVPRHLFPFMRAIIANTTRDGGFPPLLLNPIDFGQVYRDRQAAREAPAEAAV